MTDTTVAAGTAAKEVIRITFEENVTDIDDVETRGLRLLNDKVGVGVLPSKSYSVGKVMRIYPEAGMASYGAKVK